MMIPIVSVTSKDLKRPQNNEIVKPVSNADSTVNHTTNRKNKLKCGSVNEIDKINDEFSDEIVHKKPMRV